MWIHVWDLAHVLMMWKYVLRCSRLSFLHAHQSALKSDHFIYNAVQIVFRSRAESLNCCELITKVKL